MRIFGEGVRHHRLRAGLTQEELADRAGLSVRGLRKLERGQVGRPRPSTVRELAGALGVPVAEWEAACSTAEPTAGGPERFHWPRPRQLPAENPRSAGWGAELAALDAALLPAGGTRCGVPVAVVSGSSRTATTALTLRWAHRTGDRYDDAQLFARLSTPATRRRAPAAVLHGFLRALGVPGTEIPTDTDDAAALYRSLLSGRRALVVLVGATDVGQVRPLLPGGPGAAVLVTCRRRPAPLAAAVGAVTIELGRADRGSAD